jgi:hypothetical protein
MEYPRELLDIVKEAVVAHGDIEKQVSQAIRRWSRHDEFGAWTIQLAHGQIRSLVHEQRHAINVAMRRAAGVYGKAAKVVAGEAVCDSLSRWLDGYSIGGCRLGDIPGSRLASLAESESERAIGHEFNARLLNALANRVGAAAGVLVRHVVTDADIDKLAKKLRRSRS